MVAKIHKGTRCINLHFTALSITLLNRCILCSCSAQTSIKFGQGMQVTAWQEGRCASKFLNISFHKKIIHWFWTVSHAETDWFSHTIYGDLNAPKTQFKTKMQNRLHIQVLTIYNFSSYTLITKLNLLPKTWYIKLHNESKFWGDSYIFV